MVIEAVCHIVSQRTDDVDGADVTLTADKSADCTSDLFSVHDFDIKIDVDIPLSKFVFSLRDHFQRYTFTPNVHSSL